MGMGAGERRRRTGAGGEVGRSDQETKQWSCQVIQAREPRTPQILAVASTAAKGKPRQGFFGPGRPLRRRGTEASLARSIRDRGEETGRAGSAGPARLLHSTRSGPGNAPVGVAAASRAGGRTGALAALASAPAGSLRRRAVPGLAACLPTRCPGPPGAVERRPGGVPPCQGGERAAIGGRRGL